LNKSLLSIIKQNKPNPKKINSQQLRLGTSGTLLRSMLFSPLIVLISLVLRPEITAIESMSIGSI
jgi:hypothetical protein